MTKIHIKKDLYVDKVNMMTVERFEPLTNETLDLAITSFIPRQEPKVWPRPKKLKKVWKFSNSVFKDYRQDSEVGL
jgi:hypothetical protein